MAIYKNKDIETNIKATRVNIGNTGAQFYSEDENSASIRIYIKHNDNPVNLSTAGLTPILSLSMQDGSYFDNEPVDIVLAEQGLIQYKIRDNVIKHVGIVKATLRLKSETQSIHAANFSFSILSSGLDEQVAKEINVELIGDVVRNIMTDNAMGLLDDEYKEKINHDIVDYVASNPDKYKGEDGKSLSYADLTTQQKEELRSNITDKAVTDFVIKDNSITSSKIADKTISYSKLSETYAGGHRIFNSDNLDTLTKEGVYYKFSGASPTGLPSELVGEECFIEVRAWYATSTSNYVIQTITSNNSLNKIYRRVVKGGTTPNNFSVYDLTDKGHIVAKKTLESIDLNNVDEDGYFLGLSTNSYPNLPPELAGLSFLLRTESFASHQGFVIQTIYQTSGRIDVAFKRFVQVKPNEENVVGEWFKDTSLLDSSGGSGGTAYDQSLNTTDNVRFASIKADSIEVGGELKTGTIETPPTGLVKGDMWLDTTDSNTHPILRVMS